MKMKKCILIFAVAFVLLTLSFTLSPLSLNTVNASVQSLKIDSPSCILMEAETGKVLYEKNANEIRYPASTTKIMTAILVLENCKLDDIATVSKNAISSIPADYVTSNIKEGERLTIEQLLNVLLIPSANDVAIVLAEHVSGSVSEFSNLMNQKAKEIGCKNTNFVNPNGIHDKNHVSTSYDLALIARYAMQNSTFRKIVKKTKYTLPATNKYSKADRTFTTTNELLVKNTSGSKSNYYYPDCTGIKTGYTGEAGNCLVASAKKNNMEMISVVLGAGFTNEGLSQKFLDSIALLNYAFDNYSYITIQEKDSVFQEVTVSGATNDTKNLKLLVKDDIKVLAENGIKLDELEPEIQIDNLKAPISAGTSVGNVTYTFNGETYFSDLLAMNNVYASDFGPILLRICLIIVTLYLLYLLLKPTNPNKSVKSVKKSKKDSKKAKSNSDRKKSDTTNKNKILNKSSNKHSLAKVKSKHLSLIKGSKNKKPKHEKPGGKFRYTTMNYRDF